MTGRGRHTVMLGMAPGVGKTYRALQDLRRARDAGRDVVVALLETHGRAETAAQAEGLEQLPRRPVDQRGIVHRELDLPGLLARAERTPADGVLLALIDELAHSNPPGLEHEKRWQDVEHALGAGIDVLSTVNVQHLESLNDQVAELTGVRVRETVPDRVLVDADDVVVVDLPPAALLQRLRDGQIYPPERVAAALQNFFRIEQLTALRETALLQAAEEVGARRTGASARSGGRAHTGELPRVAFPVGPPPARLEERGDRDRRVADDVPDVVKERILVLVSAGPAGQRVVRRAWRSARRLRAGIDLLHVRRPGRAPTVVEAERLDGIRRLAASLGAELLVEEDDEVEAAAARVARERGTTYLFVGAPGRARGLARWRRSGGIAIDELLRRLPGVDVRIVSERAAGERGERRER
ncbi:histidine kinase [Patulibacter defluvii]|uniref:histidine kinase n=1 Tax=Patulibacter defluvii TaxID=3095358 RepID=UPI002A74D9B6|nr:histidine kinase [Patulibacter sp. DM4]